MPHLLLPKLSTHHSVPSPPSAGVWNVQKPPVLDNIAAGLVTDIGDYFNVDAIPDVWARPLLFEMALYDPKHQLHERVVGEWRGLATIIALHEWRNLDVAAIPVNIGNIKDDFGEVAEKLAPTKALFAGVDWNTLYVWTYNGRAIGVTSPTTLFCTAHDCRAHGIPWFNGKRLCDPTKVDVGGGKTEDVLSTQERGAVAAWIEHLTSNLRNQQGEKDDTLWTNLLERLQSFGDDLAGNGSTSNHSIRQDALGIVDHSIFKHLDEVPRRPKPSLKDSHVVLASLREEGYAPEAPPLLVIDKGIADQWGVSPKDVVVWGHETLDSIIPYGGLSGVRKSIKGEPLQGIEWRRADDFFTEKLVIFELGDNAAAFDNVLPIEGARRVKGSPVPPIKAELLHYFPPKDLADRIEFSTVGKDIEVQVRLELSGQQGTQPFTIRRRYERKDTLIIEQPPVLEIWPDFVSDAWHEYYTLYKGLGKFYATPFPTPEERRAVEGRYGEITKEVTVNTSFPEAMECYDPKDQQEPQGLLLLDPPQKIKTRDSAKWRVGVDFGTTSTLVYIHDERTAREITFGDRLRQIIRSEGAAREIEATLRFIPAQEQRLPLNSFYEIFDDPEFDSKPLLLGHIMYINDHRSSLGSSENGREDAQKQFPIVYTDLKWSYKKLDKVLAKQFIEQIVLQVRAEVAAHGVSNIEWVYSTPSSFSRSQERYIARVWKEIVGVQPDRRTESLATAVYFRKEHGASTNRGALCIDIGGTSTDIAIWQNNEVKAQFSLKLASRDIFVKSIVNSVYQDEFKKILTLVKLSQELVEVALISNLRDKDIYSRLLKSGDSDEVKDIQQYIVLGACGIFYYTGLIIRALIDRGQYQKELPFIYLAGNGAQMFNWLDHGEFTSTAELAVLFNNVLVGASGLKAGELEITMTPRQKSKHEVAAGLVYDHVLEGEDSSTLLAGLDFTSDKGPSHSWDSEVTEDLIDSGVSFDIGGDSHLMRLIKLINDFSIEHRMAHLKIDADNTVIKYAEEQAIQRFRKLQDKNPEEMEIEPLFIVALRAFMDSMRIYESVKTGDQ